VLYQRFSVQKFEVSSKHCSPMLVSIFSIKVTNSCVAVHPGKVEKVKQSLYRAGQALRVAGG
jgi:hypothetical protein